MRACPALVALALFVQPVRASGSDQAVQEVSKLAAQKSFFLPGWGQAYKGYPAKGLALGFFEAGALTEAVFTYHRAKSTQRDFRDGRTSYSRYTRKVDLTNYFLIMAGVIWGYSVLDAYITDPAPHLLLSKEIGKPVQLVYRVEF